jgi:hypothetical protein
MQKNIFSVLKQNDSEGEEPSTQKDGDKKVKSTLLKVYELGGRGKKE